MRTRTVLKVLLVLVCFVVIGTGGVIGYNFINHKAEMMESLLPREVEATWYAGWPQKNTIVFYKDGGYTSEFWGSKTGTYEMPDEHTIIMTDSYGDVTTATVGEDMILTFTQNEMTYQYYLDEEYASKLSGTDDDPEIVFLRRNAVKKILTQGKWISKEGSSLKVTEQEVSINGITHGYELADIEATERGYDFTLVDGGEYHLSGRITVEETTLLYTLQFDDMTFTADGSLFRLDS